MKKLLLGLSLLFICTIAIAHTINWHVGNQIISTTTCNTGDDITPPTAPAKYGYHFKGWGQYILLEYIESNGRQFINTGEKITTDLKMDITFNILRLEDAVAGVNGSYIMGNYSNNDGRFFMYKKSDKSLQTAWGCKHIDTSWIFDTNVHTASFYIENSKSFVDIDGVNILKRDSLSVLPDEQIRIGGTGFERPIPTRTFDVRFYKNGLLTKELVPAKRNLDGKIGMYDLISGVFFAQELGMFIAGPVAQ